MAEFLLMTVRELSAATGGSLVNAPEGAASFSSVVIDSRVARPGSLFVALRGTAQDGHSYVAAAFGAGAVVALVDEEAMVSGGSALRAAAERAGACLVVVRNTLAALQAAAGAYLNRYPSLLRIGITGSSGKTTTKELAAAMISVEKSVIMNQGNLNSETGLPLSLFAVRPEHEVGVFEMGMNRRGEMGELAAVLRPHIALVTNIGTAHIGILGSIDAIAEEKKAIFSRFTGAETALIPEQDVYASYLAKSVFGRVRAYGPGTLSAFGGSRSLGLEGSELLWAGIPARLSLPGAHNVANVLAAAAIAEEAGIAPSSIRAGIEAAKPLFGRGEIIHGALTVVRDCYNANPDSTEAAIALCDSVDWTGRRLYVIGSMLELGADSDKEHRRIGTALALSKANGIFLFGPETEIIAAVLRTLAPEKPVFRSDDMNELSVILAAQAAPGDLVLLKGSRGTALERLTDVLSAVGEKERGSCSSN